MACFATPYGLRYAAHCFNRAHAQQSRSALIPAGGRLGVTSLRTCLTRPDLIPALSAATGLDEAMIVLVSERAEELRNWLAAEGYTDLRAEIPLLGFSPDGAEIPGTIDLLAVGSEGCLLIDHKSGGKGEGFSYYWPQLSSYGALVESQFPQHPLKGLAVLWIDHGRLELAAPPSDGESPEELHHHVVN